MFGLLRIAGLSAVLSAVLVTAFDRSAATQASPAAQAKVLDRLPQGEGEPAKARAAGRDLAAPGSRDAQRPAAGCAGQAWPYIAPACVTAADGAPVRAARLITIEERHEDAGTSVLVRLPAALAQR